jgi:hypothetical protein
VAGVPVESVEQVGVGQDRGSSGRHMPAYIPRWRRSPAPWHDSGVRFTTGAAS